MARFRRLETAVRAAPRSDNTPAVRWPSLFLLANLLVAGGSGLFVAGCSGAPLAQPVAEPDRPVPADEPRREVTLRVELPAVSDCEERFDLALYRDRRVDLITWDERHRQCGARVVVIRYLAQHIQEDAVLALVRPLAPFELDRSSADDPSPSNLISGDP